MALVPETVARLVTAGYEVVVEPDAGAAASFPDDAYRAAGATDRAEPAGACEDADVVLKVREPPSRPAPRGRPAARGRVLIAFLGPRATRS